MKWHLQVDDKIRLFHRGKWHSGTVLECLSPELNPRQQATGWKIRLASGRIRSIWESSFLQVERVLEKYPPIKALVTCVG